MTEQAEAKQYRTERITLSSETSLFKMAGHTIRFKVVPSNEEYEVRNSSVCTVDMTRLETRIALHAHD
jgi:hypothetical protein